MNALDDIFELFTRERRRFALYYLEEQAGPVSVRELAETIEGWEDDGCSSVPHGEKYDEIVLTLKHQHLPKAAQAEYVEYDDGEQVVEITGAPAEFRVILSVAEAIEQPGQEDIISLI